MLTANEKKYLSKISKDKIVNIHPYDDKLIEVVDTIRQKLISAGIRNEILWIGASALGIAGQNDIDLHILSESIEWESLSTQVSSVYGACVQDISIYKWELDVDGFEVELYLSDPEREGMKAQLRVFEALKHSEKLRMVYEELKLQFDGKSFRDYMRAKYEFFHKILDTESVS